MKKIFTLLFVLASLVSFSQSTTLVISQLYGAGGNNGASLNADFVELHNISGAAVSLAGMTIQYSSATNTGDWTGVSPLPSVSVPAGGYYLIQMSSTGANGTALPTPDYVSDPTIAMGGTSGKVALVNGLTALTGCPLPSAGVIDAVGYGTANCFEGAAATAAVTTTLAAIRNNNGCAETDNNSADFTVAVAAPRNSASPVFICSSTPPVPTLTAGTVLDFGSVVVGTNSASQTFNISGSNLTGAPGTITITAPSINFQVSNNNTTWGATTTIPYTSATLAATPVYVRFTPQTAGPKTGNVTVTGGGAATAVNVAVSGNGVTTAVATVTVTVAPAGFGNICVGSTGGPNTFTINGSNLTSANLVVGPLNGFTFSTTSGGTYTPSLTLTHPAGSFVQQIFIQFAPTAIASYNGNVTVTGGGLATPLNIPVTGLGANTTPSVVTGTATAVTSVSATLAGTIPATGCSAYTAYGFEYSLVSGFTNGTVVPSSNISAMAFTAGLVSLLPGTTYYYRAFATNAGGTSYGTEQSFTTAAAPPATLSATALSGFGTTCANTTVGPNSFNISGVNLSGGDITVGPLTGFTFSSSLAGSYTASLTLTQPGGTYNQDIFVNFTPPAIGDYTGSIPVTGGGVAAFSVPVSGTADGGGATVITGAATDIRPNSATTAGSIAGSGCSAAFAYGIEYSAINGFINGTGFKVPSTNLTGTDFTSQLSGLVQYTIYYYKAYAENNGGITYGDQNSFRTDSLPNDLVIYSSPIIRGQNLHFSIKPKDGRGIKPGHYSARIFNSLGQFVYQKDFIVQVNFMDYTFIFPQHLPGGMYNLRIGNYEYKIQKTFYVQ